MKGLTPLISRINTVLFQNNRTLPFQTGKEIYFSHKMYLNNHYYVLLNYQSHSQSWKRVEKLGYGLVFAVMVASSVAAGGRRGHSVVLRGARRRQSLRLGRRHRQSRRSCGDILLFFCIVGVSDEVDHGASVIASALLLAHVILGTDSKSQFRC